MISSLQPSTDQPHVLAIDLGLRLGWSCYQSDGQLIAYGSHHCGQANKLNALSYNALKRLPTRSQLFVEGSGSLLKYWVKNAKRFELSVTTLHAEEWRIDCLALKQRQCGKIAKAEALKMARALIKSNAIQAAASLRHDTAEACLIGWWALHQLGWISTEQFKTQLKL